MNGVSAFLLALGLGAASPSAGERAAQAQSPTPALERAILVASPGRVAVRLDREVYESARADLADVRVLDASGALVPFVLDRDCPPISPAEVRPAVRNQVTTAQRALSAVLDFGGRVPKDRLRLDLAGDNYRRRVTVEGSESGRTWATLVDEAWVFAIPGRGPDGEPARYETVVLPENDFPLLRVTVRPGEGETERLRLRGALVPGWRAAAREDVLRPAWTRTEVPASGETWLTLDTGARRQPFQAVEIEADDARFFREVVVEARRDPAVAGEPIRFAPLGAGEIHRLEDGGVRGECRRIEVAGRERVLRLRIRNGDDRPLAIRGVSLLVPVERVAFEALPGRSYRLAYGSPHAQAPTFDLVRTLESPTAWADAATTVDLGPAVRHPPRPQRAPWTERHPALLWVALVGVVIVLGSLTYRALSLRPPQPR